MSRAQAHQVPVGPQHLGEGCFQGAAAACGDSQGGLSQQPASFPLAVLTQPPASPLLRRASEEEMWSRLPGSLLWLIPAIQGEEEGELGGALARAQPAAFRC